MVFERYMVKLEEIEKKLNSADYAVAKNIISRHLESELKGNALLSDLRGYVNQYESILKELLSDVDALAHDTTTSRIVRRNECKGKVELARQQLGRIKEILAEAMKGFEE